jgi:hypothetical protein
MTYKSSVEKSESLLDSLYLRYKNDDSFRSVKDDDENDQSVRVDKSMKKRDQSSEDKNSEDENSEDENSELENSENSDQKENLIETVSSAESLTEMQLVKRNLISSSADSSQSVRIDQVASFAENTLIVSAGQDDDDDHFVLTNDSNSDDQTNDQIDDQTNNRRISDENNSLILNFSRSKIRHDYKQLHHKDFVKAAKQIESIKSIADHDLVTFKTIEQVITSTNPESAKKLDFGGNDENQRSIHFSAKS